MRIILYLIWLVPLHVFGFWLAFTVPPGNKVGDVLFVLTLAIIALLMWFLIRAPRDKSATEIRTKSATDH
ncbi:hypothetical protein [Nocardiopsis ganjiahuensis]|uniref:hypothetical protein n=1 Tax=Nocardiopsis ganjiahuensis TaxID=239984 RepID=UPI00036D1C12|nr:hypothetical protein [Nocardiopsis ganjiahuensis]